MKTKEAIIAQFDSGSIISRFIESFLLTAESIDFKSLLDYSFNHNITISSDYGGEDKSSNYFVYSATFSTFKPTLNWMNEIKDKFSKLGYKGEPQYKDIKTDSEHGKFIEYINIANQFFKGFVVSLAVPKTIECTFGKSLAENHAYVKSVANIDNYQLSEKNTEKALRISALISVALEKTLMPDSGYYWLSDKDAIAKIYGNDNMFENTVKLQMNILNNILENPVVGPVGYSLPWEGEDSFQSYSFIALNDLFSGSLADILTGEPYKNKSFAILHHSKNIEKFFYKIKHDDKGYSASRIIIETEKD